MTERREPLEKTENTLRRIGQLIGSQCPPGFGFATIFFTFEGGNQGVASYISNGRREDMIKALRECAFKLEMGEKI